MSAKAAALNVVKAAEAKGWKRVEFRGSDEFVRNAMRIALDRGLEVVAKDDRQAEILEHVMEAKKKDDRAREAIERAVAEAERASRGLERASRSLGSAGERLECKSREFDQRTGRSDEIRKGVEAMADMELERFKTEINLVDYMQAQGWTPNKKKSTRKTAVLESQDGRKALVSLNENGHYVFFDPATGAGGSIIDFVKAERGLNLGQVRKVLRPMIGADFSSLSPRHQPRLRLKLERSSRDEREFERVRVVMTDKYARLKPLDDGYLRSRGITISDDPRFSNVKSDERGNTCFPHYVEGGIIGWEKKNRCFTGYTEGGKRAGIYATTNFGDAQKVVIVESGIDAMSHAQLFRTNNETAYISVGGSISKSQLQLICDRVAGRDVILAFDNDAAGLRFDSIVSDALGGKVEIQKPRLKDWNDDLKEKTRELSANRPRGFGM
jgi:5S rRNA maturation endonuclease (ribonuclease M5)